MSINFSHFHVINIVICHIKYCFSIPPNSPNSRQGNLCATFDNENCRNIEIKCFELSKRSAYLAMSKALKQRKCLGADLEIHTHVDRFCFHNTLPHYKTVMCLKGSQCEKLRLEIWRDWNWTPSICDYHPITNRDHHLNGKLNRLIAWISRDSNNEIRGLR